MFEIAEGRILAGKYALERPLARGGMGVVWVVRHVQLDAMMAAKFMGMSTVASPTARSRFEREARAAAQLSSPHVVQVHDYGVEADTPYLIMELLRGEDLGARLRRMARLSPAAVSEMLSQAARALRRAHDAGIVHRDLKPGNVFLARNDDVEVVKLLDFGIAKTTKYTAAEEATKSGQILGSIHYMSPEQVRSPAEVDHRTDLWALAAIAYRSLAGEYPFPSDDVYSAILSICDDPLVPPSRHAPGLTREIDRFFERALAKDPAARFQTAPELAAAFAEAAAVRLAPSELSRSPSHPANHGPATAQDGSAAGTRDHGKGVLLDGASTSGGAASAPEPEPLTADSAPLFPLVSSGNAAWTRAERSPRESMTEGISGTSSLSTRTRSSLPSALGALAAMGLAGMGLSMAVRALQPTSRPPTGSAVTVPSAAPTQTAPPPTALNPPAPAAVGSVEPAVASANGASLPAPPPKPPTRGSVIVPKLRPSALPVERPWQPSSTPL
jgi:serine/threonine-protein kinase